MKYIITHPEPTSESDIISTVNNEEELKTLKQELDEDGEDYEVFELKPVV